MSVNLNELDEATREKLNLGNLEEVEPRVLALGKIINALTGLTKGDALWALRTTVAHVRGRRNRSEKCQNAKKGGAVQATTIRRK